MHAFIIRNRFISDDRFLFMFSFFMRLIEINSALVKPYLSTLINIIITLKSIAAHFTS